MVLDYALVIGAIGAVASFLAWYRAYTRSMYAREREISHIHKSIEQQNSNVLQLFAEIEARLESTTRGIEQLSNRVERLEIAYSFTFKGGQDG
jgi:ferritin-like metal-binding protein YciE